MTDLHFFNATSGWLDVDGPQNVLYRTDDGGQKWNAVDVGASGIEQLFFIDEAHGWALGGVLLRTTDGGAHWQNVNTPR